MNQERKAPDFWSLVRALVALMAGLPVLWRLAPLVPAAQSLLERYGLVRTLEEVLPALLKQTLAHRPWSLVALGAALVVNMAVFLCAGSALNIMVVRMLHRLGLRAEESVDSRLLHPEDR